MATNYNPFSLEGKTILVTGASSGIGQATAIECSKMGAKLVITGRNAERLQDTMNQLEGEGHSVVVADLATTEGVEMLAEQAPILDGLVNNAGYNQIQLVSFIKIDIMRRLFDVNALAPIYITNRLVKAKKLAKGASVVFTSSIAGRGTCSVGNSLYSATKGAVSAFTRNAALDLACKMIRCNSVAPGMIETPLKDAKSEITEEQWKINLENYPLKRFGSPVDVANAIIYLLSDASAWVTGAEIVVDGGRSLK